MKKRILALVLMLALLASLTVTAGAAGTSTVTVMNVNEGAEYKLYKVFDVEYNETTGAYVYLLPAAYNGMLAYSADINGDSSPEDMSYYFDSKTAGGKTYVSAKFDSNSSAAAVAAKLIKSYLDSLMPAVVPAASFSGDSTGTATAPGLPYAYYLLCSEVGDICSLGTLVPQSVVGEATLTIREKNLPGGIGGGGVEKECEWDPVNEKYIYTITVTSPEKGKKFLVHDYSTGLDIDIASVTVTPPTGVTVENRYVEKKGEGGYTVTMANQGECPTGCNMHIYFTTNTELPAYSVITIKYSAVASGSGTPTNGATVEVWDKDDNNITDNPGTPIISYSFRLEKQDSSTDTQIDGAKFLVYKMDAGTEYYAKFAFNGADTYSFKGWTATIAEATAVEVGACWIKGIPSSTVYLVETDAPDGYVKSDAPVVLKFEKGSGVQTITVESGNATENDTTVFVPNTPGTPLPETGGMGTDMVYAMGCVLLLAAAAALIMKKRSVAE